jgi:hypothetical protein
MVYVDPLKLQAHQLSPMDVVRATDESNLILPAGDARIGPTDYNLYTNAQVPNANALNELPLKTEGDKSVFISDVGKAVDGSALQCNIVRVNGQRSVYVPILKQGGDTNTIAVVDGIEGAIKNLRDIPSQLKTHVVFDQSLFVKQAISTVLREGGIGLLLTALMILIFLGSPRATAAVFLSIPLSVMAAVFLLHSGDETINSMVLSGLALAFSRLIDNSVVVLENIFRHIELGESPAVASEQGANEVSLAVLAITLVTVVVFFPVTLLLGSDQDDDPLETRETRELECGRMLLMFRAQAVLVVIALLATPLVLVARGIVCDPAECTCMVVCARQVSHSQPMCGAAKHAPMCGTHQGHHALDYGFIAPFAPAVPLPHAQLAAPASSSAFVAQYVQSPVVGFSSTPFQPPRS